MKAFFAYALLIMGIPMYVGMAVGAILIIPISRLVHGRNLLYLEFINAFAASLAGGFLFRLFGLMPRIAVPIIMAVWITFYFFAYNQPKRAWVSWLLGLIIGWIAFTKIVGA